MNAGQDEHLATSVRPVGAGRQLVEERDLRSRLLLAAKVPVLGGLLAGTFVGVAESTYITFLGYGTKDYSGQVYAVLLYGALGVAMGAGLGLLAALFALARGNPPEEARSWTVSFLAVAGSLGLVIGRFCLKRDYAAEGELALAPQVVLVAVIGVLSVLFYVLVRNALAKTLFSFFVHARGSAAVYLLILAFWLLLGIGTCMDNRAASQITVRPVPPALEDKPNILLVVVDTLRADALGSYGAPDDPTPHTDALAAEGLVFEQAVASAPWTRPSFASLFTSTAPCSHQTFRKADSLPDELETLAEQLQLHGYTTGAIINNINVTASWGFHQGYDTFEFLRPAYPLRASEASFQLTVYQGVRRVWERLVQRKVVQRYYRDAEEVTAEAEAWLLRHGSSRWFLTVHYMDPHDPYFRHPYDGTAYGRAEHPRPDPAEAGALEQLYAGEVTYYDEHFGDLLDWLEEQGLADNTVVVVTSDHGEEFGEHGGFWHGNRLYDETMRVPLILKVPDRTPRHVTDQVRLLDVAPTLADLAGAPHGRHWQGFSLLREYDLREERDRLALLEADFEGYQLRAVRDLEWKLIENQHGPPGQSRPAAELFHLASDPDEQEDLADSSSARYALEPRAARLSALQTAACTGAVTPSQRPEGASAADCELLRSLGYVDIAEGLCGG